MGQPSLEKLRPMGGALPQQPQQQQRLLVLLLLEVYCLELCSHEGAIQKMSLGMTGPIGQPSLAKLRPVGRARLGTVGLSWMGRSAGEKHAVFKHVGKLPCGVQTGTADKVQTGRVQTKQQSSGQLFLAWATESATPVRHSELQGTDVVRTSVGP